MTSGVDNSKQRSEFHSSKRTYRDSLGSIPSQPIPAHHSPSQPIPAHPNPSQPLPYSSPTKARVHPHSHYIAIPSHHCPIRIHIASASASASHPIASILPIPARPLPIPITCSYQSLFPEKLLGVQPEAMSKRGMHHSRWFTYNREIDIYSVGAVRKMGTRGTTSL